MSIKQILKVVKKIIKPASKPVVEKVLVLDKKDLAATVKSTVQESKSSMTRETN
tara:strand:+ start:230 stop:391 length:162 start_codon:yes stop_codon:yes gene_type:complete